MESARILLIIDDEAMAKYLREKLTVEGGYTVSLETSERKNLELLCHNNFDLVIAQIDNKDLKSIERVKNLKKIDPGSIIIAFISEASPSLLKEIHRLEIYDFVARPVNLEKLFFLIKKGAQLHAMTVTYHKLIQDLHERNIVLQKQNTLLAKRIEESTTNLTRLYEDLRLTYMRTIKVLAQAIDARDHYTHSHSENVAKYSVAIAKEMHISSEEIEIIREACELHDLGKIGIEDSILGKPSSLTTEEWKQIRAHPMTAAQILEPLTFLNSAIDLIKQHHEHYDGSGYPEGLRGEDILLGGRIIHLADAYEAMRSPRSYRKEPFSKEEAILEIKKNSGTQFDPKVVEVFLKIVDNL